jgi:AraC-like DNA-binding protein
MTPQRPRMGSRPSRAARPESPARDEAPVLVPSTSTPEAPLVAVLNRDSQEHCLDVEMHATLEVGVLVSGMMDRDHGRGWFRVAPGQAWVCASFQPHQYRLREPRTVRMAFHFLPSLFWRMPDLSGFDPLALFRSPARFDVIGSHDRAKSKLAELAEEFAGKYRRALAPGRAFVDLLRIIDLIASRLRPRTKASADAAGEVVRVRSIQPALELLAQTPHRAVRVPEAARACRMAYSTFRRCFQAATGLTFSAFELRWRLTRAAHELRRSGNSAKAVASCFGFADVSHFHHAFVKHHSVTPGQYRDNDRPTSRRQGRRPANARG